jgi:hypothetical protein
VAGERINHSCELQHWIVLHPVVIVI